MDPSIDGRSFPIINAEDEMRSVLLMNHSSNIEPKLRNQVIMPHQPGLLSRMKVSVRHPLILPNTFQSAR